MCVIEGERPSPAALTAISARGASLETSACAVEGARVHLRHPAAGSIEAIVRHVRAGGIALEFDLGEASVAFALAAIAADMTRGD